MGQKVLDLGHLALASDEAREGRGQGRGRRRARDRPRLGVEGGVLDEDRLLQLLEGGAGLEPELLPEVVGGPPVGAQRLSLPSRAVEGEHELAPQRLPQRVL